MKKLLVGLLVGAMVCFAFAGCRSSQPEVTEPPVGTNPVETTPVETTQTTEPAAPVFSSFEDMTWTRESETCTETIRFRSDGSCSYSCACGDPVNDADLCEGYRYDQESKTIVLEFVETTEETVTQITVQSCDGKTLVLDFAGDVRTFRLQEDAAA